MSTGYSCLESPVCLSVCQMHADTVHLLDGYSHRSKPSSENTEQDKWNNRQMTKKKWPSLEEKGSIAKLLCPRISIVTQASKPLYGWTKVNSLFQVLETQGDTYFFSFWTEYDDLPSQKFTHVFLRVPKFKCTAHVAALQMHLQSSGWQKTRTVGGPVCTASGKKIIKETWEYSYQITKCHQTQGTSCTDFLLLN